MITLAISAVVGAVLGWRTSVGNDKVLRTLYCILGLFAGLLVGLIVGGCLSFFGPGYIDEFVKESEIRLVAMKDSRQIEGSFFLASGSIGEKMYYHFYYEPRKGVSRYGRLEATDCDVFEEPALKDTGYIRYRTTRKAWPKEFKESTLYKFVIGGQEGVEKTITSIHVPAGTIKRGFVLALG